MKNIIKKSALLLILILLCPTNAFAVKTDMIYTEIGIFKAQVYVCDDVRSTVVLKSVTPVETTDDALSIVKDAEYAEIPVRAELVRIDNNFAYLSTVNTYMLDKTASVVIGRNTHGLKILYMNFDEE